MYIKQISKYVGIYTKINLIKQHNMLLFACAYFLETQVSQ